MKIEGNTLIEVETEDLASDGSITVPEGVTKIAVGAFRKLQEPHHTNLPYLWKFKSVNLPLSLQTIEVGAFERCKGLISLTIPAGVISIEQNAFSFCSWLTDVTIPAGMKSIHEHAFTGCYPKTVIINTEKEDEFNRVKALLPFHLQGKAIYFSEFIKVEEMRAQVLDSIFPNINREKRENPRSFFSQIPQDIINLVDTFLEPNDPTNMKLRIRILTCSVPINDGRVDIDAYKANLYKEYQNFKEELDRSKAEASSTPRKP